MKILTRGSRRESKEVASVFPTHTLHLPRRKQNLKITKTKFFEKIFYNCLGMPYFFPRWYGPENKTYMFSTAWSILNPSLALSYFITGMDRSPTSKLSFHAVNFGRLLQKCFLEVKHSDSRLHVILLLWRLRQEDGYKFEASLSQSETMS